MEFLFFLLFLIIFPIVITKLRLPNDDISEIEIYDDLDSIEEDLDH